MDVIHHDEQFSSEPTLLYNENDQQQVTTEEAKDNSSQELTDEASSPIEAATVVSTVESNEEVTAPDLPAYAANASTPITSEGITEAVAPTILEGSDTHQVQLPPPAPEAVPTTLEPVSGPVQEYAPGAPEAFPITPMPIAPVSGVPAQEYAMGAPAMLPATPEPVFGPVGPVQEYTLGAPGAATVPYGPYTGQVPPPVPAPGTWQPSMYMPSQTVRPPRQPAAPLPLWVFLGGIALITALIVAVFLLGSDWADGAAKGSIAAGILAVVLAVAWFVRTRIGGGLQSRRVRSVLSVCFLLVLLLYTGIAQAGQTTLHMAEGHFHEGQQQWQQALNEYTLVGEKAPDGLDLARTYTSWGLALSQSQHYQDARIKFDFVFDHFTSDQVKTEVKRAQVGDIAARLGQAHQSIQTKNYSDATDTYDAILNLSYCDSACKSQTRPLDASAYYTMAEADLNAQKYEQAVNAFDQILINFTDLPEAKKSHGDMAKALMGQGEANRAVICSSALDPYQKLAKDYSDTPEGQKAQQALKQPVDVKGHFVNYMVGVDFTQVGLLQGINKNTSKDDLFNKWDNTSLKADIQDNGDFVFHNVPQGTYDLVWYTETDTIRFIQFIYLESSNEAKFVANVGPLCAFDMGTVSNMHE